MHYLRLYNNPLDGPRVPGVFVIGGLTFFALVFSLLMGSILLILVFTALFILNLVLHNTHGYRRIGEEQERLMCRYNQLPPELRAKVNLNPRRIDFDNLTASKLREDIESLQLKHERRIAAEKRCSAYASQLQGALSKAYEEEVQGTKIAEQVYMDLKREGLL